MKRIGITTGDPAGIGPEIAVKALRFHSLKQDLIYIVYGSYPYSKHGYKPVVIDNVDLATQPGAVYHISIENDSVVAGEPSSSSGKVAFEILERCSVDLNAEKLDGIVTGPVSKEYIKPFDNEFIGHTEYLAKRSNVDDVAMTFWGPVFDLALLSTHKGLCELSEYLTEERVESMLRLIHKEYTKIKPKAKIALLAINPHGGENGMFGSEDIMMEKVVLRLAEDDIYIDGPFPADTFFAYNLKGYDLVISPYHDQGLIPFKMLSKGSGVNVTLGLPFYRTSVDHGTAFDIAGTGRSDSASMKSALEWLEKRLSDEKITSTSYNIFAEYYDDYMGHVDYKGWMNLVLDEYKLVYNQEPSKVLEIACGTANVACQLVKKGFDVDASDNSEAMLSIAAKKKYSPNLYLADMADVIDGKYDLILCLFDSVNYLLKISQVEQMFLNVKNALTDNGMFIFDVSTLRNSIENFDDFVNIESNDELLMLHEAEFDSKRLKQYSNLTLFRKDMYGYKRYKESHLQTVYPLSELISSIVKCGLDIREIKSPTHHKSLLSMQPEAIEDEFERVFFCVTSNE